MRSYDFEPRCFGGNEEGFEERIRAQRWSFTGFVKCPMGHTEEVFTNPDFPGLLWHRDCCGWWKLRRGVLCTRNELYLEEKED